MTRGTTLQGTSWSHIRKKRGWRSAKKPWRSMPRCRAEGIHGVSTGFRDLFGEISPVFYNGSPLGCESDWRVSGFFQVGFSWIVAWIFCSNWSSLFAGLGWIFVGLNSFVIGQTSATCDSKGDWFTEDVTLVPLLYQEIGIFGTWLDSLFIYVSKADITS